MEKEVLERRITKILESLAKVPVWACQPSSVEPLQDKAKKLLSRLSELSEQYLTIGLVGGTGVGKSTVINALAKEEISLISHRRPTTDKVIIYCHEEAPLLIENPGISYDIYRHNSEEARYFVLCDLPDFDSIKQENKRKVIDFLEKLDILVFVVSPEKYGDESLYVFIKEIPKDPSNFCFLVNKIDLLYEEPHQIGNLLETFKKYLKDLGIEHPLIFTVSSLEVLSNQQGQLRPWNQWESFRRELLRERTFKEIREIKTTNIAKEIRELEAQVEALAKQWIEVKRALETLRRDLVELKPWWEKEGNKVVKNFLNKNFEEALIATVFEAEDLQSFSKLAFHVYKKFSKSFQKDFSKDINVNFEEAKVSFSALENFLSRKLLMEPFSKKLFEEVSSLYSHETLWNKWKEALEDLLLNMKSSNLFKSSFPFKLAQSLTYKGLLVIFILSFGKFWKLSLQTLEPYWFLEKIFTFFEKLFSIEGLGAILSLACIEIAAGFYFVSLRIKNLRLRAQKFIELFALETLKLWNQTVEELTKALEEREKELEFATMVEGLG